MSLLPMHLSVHGLGSADRLASNLPTCLLSLPTSLQTALRVRTVQPALCQQLCIHRLSRHPSQSRNAKLVHRLAKGGSSTNPCGCLKFVLPDSLLPGPDFGPSFSCRERGAREIECNSAMGRIPRGSPGEEGMKLGDVRLVLGGLAALLQVRSLQPSYALLQGQLPGREGAVLRLGPVWLSLVLPGPSIWRVQSSDSGFRR